MLSTFIKVVKNTSLTIPLIMHHVLYTNGNKLSIQRNNFFEWKNGCIFYMRLSLLLIIKCQLFQFTETPLMTLSGLDLKQMQADQNDSIEQLTAILMSFEIAVLLSFASNYNDDDYYYYFGACKRNRKVQC